MPDEPASGASDTAPGRMKQAVATLVTILTLVIVFAVVLPQFADYGHAWDAISGISGRSLVLLALVTAANVLAYVWPFQAALPGLSLGPAFTVRQTSFAISNAVPGGGAFGLGVQYSMLADYGFEPGPSSAAIGVTTVWNTLVTLALPVLAVLAVAATGDLREWVVGAAVAGFVFLAVAVVGLYLVFRSEAVARGLGRFADSLVSRVAKVFRRDVATDITAALLTFRASTKGLVRRRGLSITLANTAQQLMQFLVLLAALRAVQGDAARMPIAGAFAAFAIGRLGGFIPLTPGGLGTVDALMTGILVVFGADEADALAATLVWRAATYFPQMFIGIGTFLHWRRGKSKISRRAGDSRPDRR